MHEGATDNEEAKLPSGAKLLSGAESAIMNIKNKYDMIITNPPIHAGKTKVYEIIRGASNYLNENGELWIVIRKDQGAKSLIKDMSDIYNFEIVKRDNGFYILRANKI